MTRREAGTKHFSPVQLIEEILHEERSIRAGELAERIMSKDPSCSEDEILESLESLRRDGRVTFLPPRFHSFGSFFAALHWNMDFWMVLGVVIVYALLQILPISSPWTLLLVPSGVLLIFYLPGRIFLKIFGRNYAPLFFERYILEIGISILIAMVAGLLLNFILGGFEPDKLIQAVVGLNLSLAVIGSYVDYSKLRR